MGVKPTRVAAVEPLLRPPRVPTNIAPESLARSVRGGEAEAEGVVVGRRVGLGYRAEKAERMVVNVTVMAVVGEACTQRESARSAFGCGGRRVVVEEGESEVVVGIGGVEERGGHLEARGVEEKGARPTAVVISTADDLEGAAGAVGINDGGSGAIGTDGELQWMVVAEVAVSRPACVHYCGCRRRD